MPIEWGANSKTRAQSAKPAPNDPRPPNRRKPRCSARTTERRVGARCTKARRFQAVRTLYVSPCRNIVEVRGPRPSQRPWPDLVKNPQKLRKHPPVSGGRLLVVFGSRCRPRRKPGPASVSTRIILVQLCVAASVRPGSGRVHEHTTLGFRPAPGTPSAKRSVGTRRAASMQDSKAVRCPKEPHAQRSWHLQRSPSAQLEDLPPEVWLPTLSDDERSSPALPSTPRDPDRACSSTP
jgi:hypothetical protein